MPPVGGNVKWSTNGTWGGTVVGGPASTFRYPFSRAPGVPYGWNRLTEIRSVLAGPELD